MIAHNRPTLGDAEAQAAAQAVLSGYVARGPQVRMLEEELCAWLGLQNGCVALTSSGTAALFLALETIGARGRRVAFPAYACSALRNAVAMIGAHGSIVDCAPESPNIDTVSLRAASSEIAIVPHMYGIPANTLDIDRGILVIDDAAQALGARVRGKAAGSTGTAGILSFYATKMMTTGGNGGAVVSNDPAFIAQVHDYLDFDCRQDQRLRFNFQIGDVQAAIGRVQLKRLPEFIERRSQIFSMYAHAGLNLLGADPANGSEPVRYRAIVRTPQPRALIDLLAAAGIGAIVPTEDWELPPGLYPHAFSLTQTTVSLPIYPSLADAEVESVVRIVDAAV